MTEVGPRVEIICKDGSRYTVFLAPPAARHVTKAELQMLRRRFRCDIDDVLIPTPPLCPKTISINVVVGLGLAFLLFMMMVRR